MVSVDEERAVVHGQPRRGHVGALEERAQVLLIQFAVVMTAGVFLWELSLLHALVPPPQDIVASVASLLATGSFYLHLAVTLREALIGLAIAAGLGIVLGAAIGANRALADFLNPLILALYSVPKIVFLPIMLMIFGAGIGPKIANAAFHAIFPILLNALVATEEVNGLLRKVARSMRATRLQTFRLVVLPSLVLPVFSGLRLGVGLSFLGALLSELFESNAGIAFLVTRFYNEGRIDEMLAVIVVLILLIIVVNAGMQALEDRLSRWRQA